MPAYSEADERRIREVYSDLAVPSGAVDEVLADELGRSVTAIGRKRRRMNLNLDTRGSEGPAPRDNGGDDDNVADDVAIEAELLDYVKVGDTYVFQIDEGVYPIEAARLDEMAADYSEHGANMTAKEVARKHGLPFTIVRRIFRRLGHFKASLPVTRETLAEATDEDVVEHGLAAKERRIAAKLDRASFNKMRRELRALRAERESEQRFLEAARALMADCEPEPVTVPKIDAKPGAPWTAHVPTTDEHIGGLVWGDESFGEDYDTDIACRRLRAHADLMADWIAAQRGECEVVYRTFNGDLFDSLLGETEHGTRLDADTRPAKVYTEGIKALKYAVNRLRTVAGRVEVLGARGNHDGKFEFFAAMLHIAEAFDAADDVEVHVTPSRFSAFRVADSLHVLDHDHGGGGMSWKRLAQAEVVARNASGDSFNSVRRVFTYLGHKHKFEAKHVAHMALERLPALGETDDYSTSLRYDGGALKAFAYRLDERGRPVTVRRIYREDLTP